MRETIINYTYTQLYHKKANIQYVELISLIVTLILLKHKIKKQDKNIMLTNEKSK